MSFLSADTQTSICTLYEGTQLSVTEIGVQVGVASTTIHRFIRKTFPEDLRKQRTHTVVSAASKRAATLVGLTGERHHKYKEFTYTQDGYVKVLKPLWFTGRQKHTRCYLHHVVMCQHLGITEIPKGYCVHHIDFNKDNNDLNNLSYLTHREHGQMHRAAQIAS